MTYMDGCISGRVETRDPATSNAPKVGRKYANKYKRGTISIQIFDDSPGTITRSVRYYKDGSVKVINRLPCTYQISLGYTKVRSVKRYPNREAARRAAERYVDNFIAAAQALGNTN